jgi:hypothetical protein
MKVRLDGRNALRASLVALVLVAAAEVRMARAEEQAPAGGATSVEGALEAEAAETAEESLLDPRAVEAVKRMVSTLRDAQKLSYRIESSYDAIQEHGESIEFGGHSETTIRRPDRVAGQSWTREGKHFRFAWDGKTIGVYDENDNVYASAAHSGDIDSFIDFLREDVGLKLPTADLFSLDLGKILLDAVVAATWIGRQTLHGEDCDHVALLSRQRIGVQLWIRRGEQAVPERVVITYGGARGTPQFRADFTKWDLSPSARDSLFELDPPRGAKQVPFVLPKRAAKAASGEGEK